jgi:chromosome segregation ATPase
MNSIRVEYLDKIEYHGKSIRQATNLLSSCKEKLDVYQEELKTYRALLAVLALKEGNIRVEGELKDKVQTYEKHIDYIHNQIQSYEMNLKRHQEDLKTYQTLLEVLNIGGVSK